MMTRKLKLVCASVCLGLVRCQSAMVAPAAARDQYRYSATRRDSERLNLM